MKKALKLLLPVLAALLVLAAGIGLYSYGPMLAMHPAETGQIPLADGQVLAIRSGRGAMYLTDTGDGVLVIDAGTNAGKTEAALGKLGIDPADVKWVLLTHSDHDHVAGLPLFPNAEIYMGEAELCLLDGTVNRNASGGNKLPDGIDLSAIKLLGDGEELLLGGARVKCIAAPGHTPGSMAYLVNGSWLFAGDAFRYRKGEFTVHPFTMDEALALQTIEKLPIHNRSADVITVLTSHYGYIPSWL